MLNPKRMVYLSFLACICLGSLPAIAQEGDSSSKAGDDMQTKYDAFSKTLTGSKFIGNFTELGKENADLTPEEYHIKSVQKMEQGDYWLFTARIKYGGKDVSIPMPLEVKWAGDTAVITVTDFRIFGYGPFSSRVVVYNGKYAGTWSHGDVGGHLFGVIKPGEAEGVDVEKTKRDMESREEKSDSRKSDDDKADK